MCILMHLCTWCTKSACAKHRCVLLLVLLPEKKKSRSKPGLDPLGPRFALAHNVCFLGALERCSNGVCRTLALAFAHNVQALFRCPA